jgi:DNA-directed RNA polymerase subunit delta
MDKKRIVKDYENLPEEVINQVKVTYPAGFADHLVSFTNKDGKRVSALPFETADIYYLIRMTIMEAHQIIEDDEDYDDDGTLRNDFSLERAEEEIVESSDDEDEDPSSKKRRGHNDAYTMDEDED